MGRASLAVRLLDYANCSAFTNTHFVSFTTRDQNRFYPMSHKSILPHVFKVGPAILRCWKIDSTTIVYGIKDRGGVVRGFGAVVYTASLAIMRVRAKRLRKGLIQLFLM